MKRTKQFYIMERHNPQLNVYYIACGRLSKAEAKRKEDAIYGYNIMHGFDSEAEYNAKLVEWINPPKEQHDEAQ